MNASERLVYIRGLLCIAFARLRSLSRETQIVRTETPYHCPPYFLGRDWVLDEKWGFTSVSFASQRLRRIRENNGFLLHVGSGDRATSGIKVSTAVVALLRVRLDHWHDEMITLGSDVNYVAEDANETEEWFSEWTDFWGNCRACGDPYCEGPFDCD